MKYLLIRHPAVEKALPVAEKFRDELKKLKENDVSIITVDEMDEQFVTDADMIITFGGDGTILHTVSHFIACDIPILGVNLGHVGFLSNIEIDEIERYIPKLVSGDYTIEKRTVLEAEIVEKDKKIGPFYCINELCIKSPKAHMLNFQVLIDDELHSSFRGDGMLISTPTGSTAYSLSAGGPVVDPELEVILMTPLVSFLLSKKPLLMAGYHKVTLLGDNEQEAFITIDGNITRITNEGFCINVKQAEHRIQLVNLCRRTFFAGLEKRLGQTAAP